MAVILVLICGCFGFGSAVAGLLIFDLSWFQALLVWMSGGFVAVILAILPALLPQRAPYEDRQAESA